MDTIEESPFIVISGPPERGKWERLSQARSILTKRQFQRIKKQQPPPNTAGISKRRYPNGETKRHDLDEQSRAVASKGNVARNAQLSRQEKPPLLPAINLSLEPVILASYTSRRLHEFLETHLHVQCQSPFVKYIVPWCIFNPHLMSAKLLNASGWDDVNNFGEITRSTLQQRFITNRILERSLFNNHESHADVTISALQSMLAFELLCGNFEYFDKLCVTAKQIFDKRNSRRDIETGDFLSRSFSLLDQAHQLRLAPSGSTESTPLRQAKSNGYLSFPGNFSCFTYADEYDVLLSCQLESSLHNTLADLYYIAAVVASPQCNNVRFLDQTISKWSGSIKYLDVDLEREDWSDFEKKPIAKLVLEMTTSLLAYRVSETYLELPPTHSMRIVAQLRTLLNPNIQNFETDSTWKLIPGALVWCHAIGLRFADLETDKTWFLMRLLSVAHVSAIDIPNTVTESIQMISDALNNI